MLFQNITLTNQENGWSHETVPFISNLQISSNFKFAIFIIKIHLLYEVMAFGGTVLWNIMRCKISGACPFKKDSPVCPGLTQHQGRHADNHPVDWSFPSFFLQFSGLYQPNTKYFQLCIKISYIHRKIFVIHSIIFSSI